MTGQTLIILTAFMTLFGCNFSEHVKQRVDNGVKDAKVQMNSEISQAKSDFAESYRQVFSQAQDSVFSIKVSDLNSSITKTSYYIDSLRAEMDKLDNMDTKNVELVRQIFLHNGIGDRVFSKLKESYSITIDIAAADTTKRRLRKVLESFSEETKKQFFELNSPLGVTMILYGIESELIRDGSRCLAGHGTK